MYFIPQLSSSDSGFTALKILLSLVKKDDSYLYIHEDENKKYYSYQDIKSIALSYGLELEGVKFSFKEKFSLFNDLPAIATINETGQAYHAVVIIKIKKKSIHFIDPNEGKRTMKKKKFLKIWDTTLLTVKKLWNYPIPKKCINLTNKAVKDVTILIEVFSSLSLILGIFFIDHKYHFSLPISFFLLFVVLTILSKIILMSNMQKIDQKVTSNLPNNHFNKAELLTRLELYKKELFVTPISLVGHLLVSLFIVAITIINDVRNFYLIAIPLFLVVFEVFFFLPFSRRKEMVLAQKEKDATNSQYHHEFKKRLKQLHTDSYEYAGIILLKRYIFLFIMMVVAFLSMYLTTKQVTLVYTIFYFSIEMVLYEHFHSLLTFKKQHISSLKAEMKLINILNEN